MKLTSRYIILLMWLCYPSATIMASELPRLVLMPVAGNQPHLREDFGAAIEQGLQSQYQVYFGAAVETALEKIYENVAKQVDCDSSVCHREIALAFSAELIAHSSVTQLESGYSARIQIRNIMSGTSVFSNTLVCRDCDELQLLERLPELGQADSGGTGPRTGSSIVLTDRGSSSTPSTSGSGEMAVLIINSEPSGAKVSINGKAAGTTPYQGLDHEIGEQLSMTLELAHHLPQQLQITLNDPITKETIQLQPGQGELLVYTEPFLDGVKVSINGKQVGTAPYKTQLSAGVHQIGVITKDGQRGSTDYTVRHGELKKLRFNVNPPQAASSGSGRSDGKNRSYTVGGVDFKLVRIPEGSFIMGSNNGEDSEKPVHRVSISSFYMMEHEVTFDLWDACVSDGQCERPSDKGWGRGLRPVIHVSWDDITNRFIPWLNRKTDKTFRLPSESEWEYAARAGSTTKYSWGDSIGRNKANCDGCGSQWDNSKTAPVKSFRPNNFGLYDMHGNVWEWTQDCWNDSYNGAPGNNRARESGDCDRRVLRGGSWFNTPAVLRSAFLTGSYTSNRHYINGFRLVQAP